MLKICSHPNRVSREEHPHPQQRTWECLRALGLEGSRLSSCSAVASLKCLIFEQGGPTFLFGSGLYSPADVRGHFSFFEHWWINTDISHCNWLHPVTLQTATRKFSQQVISSERLAGRQQCNSGTKQ